MGIEETRLLACKSIYWIGINADIETHIKNFSTCLEFQHMQSKGKLIHCKIPGRPWEVVNRDMFFLYNKVAFVI